MLRMMLFTCAFVSLSTLRSSEISRRVRLGFLAEEFRTMSMRSWYLHVRMFRCQSATRTTSRNTQSLVVPHMLHGAGSACGVWHLLPLHNSAARCAIQIAVSMV